MTRPGIPAHVLRRLVEQAAATLPVADARIHTMKQPRSLSGTYAKDRWNPTFTPAHFADPVEMGVRERPALDEEREPTKTRSS